MKLIKWLDLHFEETLMALFLIVITAVIFAQTIMRNILSSALPWPEELARYCLVCTTLLSFAYCIRKNIMLRIDILAQMMKDTLRDVTDLVLQLVSVWLYWYLFTHSLELVQAGLKNVQLSPAMRMPVYIIYVFSSVAFALAIIRQVQSAILTVLRIVRRRRGNDETALKGGGPA